MWISKNSGDELELKSSNIIHMAASPLFLLFGVLSILSSVQSGYYSEAVLGLLLAAIGFWLVSAPYETTALFDKGRGKMIITHKAFLSKKEEGYAMGDIEKIKATHVRRSKQSHDELRVLLKNGKEITLMGGAWGLEMKENAAKLASFLGLPIEEATVSEGIFARQIPPNSG